MDKIGHLQLSITEWSTVSIYNLANNDPYRTQNSEFLIGRLHIGRSAERRGIAVLEPGRTCSWFKAIRQGSNDIRPESLTTTNMATVQDCAIGN